MKRRILVLLALVCVLTSCAAPEGDGTSKTADKEQISNENGSGGSQEEEEKTAIDDYVEAFEAYTYDGPTEETWKDRRLTVEQAPQIPDGRYERYFLAGRTGEEDDWKLYELYWSQE